ncbi:MAG: hypothetical protein JSW07_18640 [bacterium]|nr:MAG: hypothetical protein JSW07_18640 [bacterium]
MAKRNAPNKTTITDGIVITVFEDDGPTNCYNSSPLAEDEAFNLGVKALMTIGSMDPLELGEIQSYGPIPTPRESYLALGFVFFLKAHSTEDSRIASFGRLIVLWVISRSNTTIKYISMIKRMIKRILLSYQIKTDVDFKQEEILRKIDEKIQIIEVSQDSYYISENGEIESFSELPLIPPTAPIMLVDHPKKEIKILLREESVASRKIELRQIANDFKGRNLPKGSLYKAEIITDSFTVQSILSKSGFLAKQDVGTFYTIRLIDQLTFEELDRFFDPHFTQRRQQLAAEIVKSYQNNTPLNLDELSNQMGISQELIEELVGSAIEARLIPNSEIDSGVLKFHKKMIE